MHPRKDKHGIDLISDVLPYSPLWYAGPTAISNAISFAKFYSRSHHALILVYDEAGNLIETHEHNGDFETRSSVRGVGSPPFLPSSPNVHKIAWVVFYEPPTFPASKVEILGAETPV